MASLRLTDVSLSLHRHATYALSAISIIPLIQAEQMLHRSTRMAENRNLIQSFLSGMDIDKPALDFRGTIHLEQF